MTWCSDGTQLDRHWPLPYSLPRQGPVAGAASLLALLLGWRSSGQHVQQEQQRSQQGGHVQGGHKAEHAGAGGVVGGGQVRVVAHHGYNLGDDLPGAGDLDALWQQSKQTNTKRTGSDRAIKDGAGEARPEGPCSSPWVCCCASSHSSSRCSQILPSQHSMPTRALLASPHRSHKTAAGK